MTDSGTHRLETVRERIEGAIDDEDGEAEISSQDYELIHEFDLLLVHDRVGDYRHAQLLAYILLIAKRRDAHEVGLSELSESKDAVKQLLRWIEEGEYYDDDKDKTYEFGEKTKTHYRSALRKFGKILNEGVLPSTMEIIYGGDRTKLSATAPKPGQILQWNEDVVPLLKACKNSRDQAIVAAAWDSGARPYEIRDLTYGDLSPDGDFLKITVGGKKTPLRDPRLVIASPFLKYWLEKKHPANETDKGFTPETPIWTCLDENRALSNTRFGMLIPHIVAPRTDVEKPTNLRNFRKSRASVLASREEIDRGDLEERQGWAKGSRIVAVYVARYGSGADNKVARSDGLKEEFIPDSEHEELIDPAPVRCPNCSRWTPSYDNECLWCVSTFNPTAAQEAEHRDIEGPVKEEARRDLIKMVTSGKIGEDDIESARELADVIRRYPELLDYADDFKEFLERYNLTLTDEDEDDGEEEEGEEDEDEEDEDDDDGVGATPMID